MVVKRDRFHAAVSGISEELQEFYEKYPQYRGKTPSFVINMGFKQWLNEKLKNVNENLPPKLRGWCRGSSKTTDFFPNVSDGIRFYRLQEYKENRYT